MKRLRATIIASCLCSLTDSFATSATSPAGGPWTIVATPTDTAGYSAPAIGNGQIGMVTDRSGLRPERMFSATTVRRGRDTKVASILPSIMPLQLLIRADGADAPVTDWRQTLDMSDGTVTTAYSLPGAEISCSLRALRSMPFVTTATIEVRAMADDVVISVTDRPVVPDNYADRRVAERTLWADGRKHSFIRAEGSYNRGADAAVSTVALTGDRWSVPSADSAVVKLSSGESATLWVVASTVTTADFADPWNESERQVLYALFTGRQQLTDRHRSAWADLWRGDILLEGDPELQSHVRSALYNLYSSLQPGSGRSIAPMGLTSDHYFGHIFWDADTWMLPVLTVLQPHAARDLIDYRIATLDKARRRAAAHGYRGAMFAWESDDLGEESTPTFALTGPLEHHITADVANGAWLYFCATADTVWLRDRAWPLLRDCADFWASRAERNPDDSYGIRSVVGADEYAIGVDDNAFTNAAAMLALRHATEAARLLGLRPDPQWGVVASGLRLHRIDGTDIIAEFDGYAGQQIKQADVALLAYPLGVLSDPAEIDRNISYYNTKIDSIGGPAMSHSAMAVNYARMGRPEQARRLIERAYRPNLRGPFHNLSESPGNDHVYFVTGAGGLLQALIFGYAGVDIDTSSGGGLRQISSQLPASLRSITVTTPWRTFRRTH